MHDRVNHNDDGTKFWSSHGVEKETEMKRIFLAINDHRRWLMVGPMFVLCLFITHEHYHHKIIFEPVWKKQANTTIFLLQQIQQ